MKKTIYTHFLLLFPLVFFGQSNTSSNLLKKTSLELSGRVSTNVLSVPTRQNTLEASGYETFEEYQSTSAGVSGEICFSPILHDNFFYTYRHEWSLGLGPGTSYYYQLGGSEMGLGFYGNYLTYHLKNRFVNVIGYRPRASNASEVKEEVHYSKYTDIRQHAFGLKFNAGHSSTLEFAFLMENFKEDENQEPWQGALFRWDRKDAGWGLETMVFWSHPAYGYYFTTEEPEGEYEPTGLFINVKLNYKFGYRNNYGDLLQR